MSDMPECCFQLPEDNPNDAEYQSCPTCGSVWEWSPYTLEEQAEEGVPGVWTRETRNPELN